MDLGTSTDHTYEIAERAVTIATDLAPAIGAHWDEINARVGDDVDHHDFGAASLRIAAVMRSLQAQLLVAAISAEIEPGRKSRKLVRRIQQRLGYWINRLRGLLLLSRFAAEADSLLAKRTYFRRIRGLSPRPEEPGPLPARAAELITALRGLEPQILIEASLGMLALAGFPDRPSSPQQQRRKRRRRRRSSPGAPTASSRADRGEE